MARAAEPTDGGGGCGGVNGGGRTQVVSQGKNVAVVVGGVVFFGNVVTYLQALGYSVSICGFVLYQRAMANKQEAEAGKPVLPIRAPTAAAAADKGAGA